LLRRREVRSSLRESQQCPATIAGDGPKRYQHSLYLFGQVDADIPTEFATAAFEILTRKRVDGLLIQGSIARKEMLDLAIKYRL
jgi:hypothetical protein